MIQYLVEYRQATEGEFCIDDYNGRLSEVYLSDDDDRPRLVVVEIRTSGSDLR